jgi:hypothetical protein
VTVIPIAQYLVHFGQGDAFAPSDLRHDEPPQLLSLDPRAAVELARQLDEAQARGRTEGHATAAAEFDLKLADEQASVEAQMAAARQAWLAEEGERLSTAMAAAFGELEAGIAGSVARILERFLAAALRDQVLAELTETLSGLLAGEHKLLKVSGPEAFLKVLRQRLGPDRASIEYLPADGLDVSVVADHTVIETRLQAFLDRLRQATD